MGYTATEKILATHSGEENLRPGQIANCRIDLVMAHDITGPLAFKQLAKLGIKGVFDPDRVVLVQSHMVPARDIASAELAMALRRFAREYQLPHYFEEGRGGIEHAVLPEEGYILPGELIVGADSHTCTYGGLGAFSTGMGSTDIAAALALGQVWLRVPETIRVDFLGDRRPFVTGKDLMLHLIGRIGVDGARYRALEFSGDAIRALPVDQRLTMCNMAIEAGAKNAVVPWDGRTEQYLNGRARRPYTPTTSDPDARYERVEVFDSGALEPALAKPWSPANVAPVGQVEGHKVDLVFIGSCTNGRLPDLRQAAAVLRGRQVAPRTRLVVMPASQRIHQEAVKEGLIDVFLEAGATVGPPSCGPCAGLHSGVVGPGEVVVSTSNRNFPGRMGHPSAQVYLANPFVAAAAAVTGEIIHPQKVAGQEVADLAG